MAVTLISDINTQYWQLSIDEQGAIVKDRNHLKQQIALALSTDKGSVPFDPEFGFNITQLIDQPVNFVIPNGKIGILETLTRDVPSVTVVAIKHELSNLSNVIFHIYITSNLGNFVASVPINQNFASPAILGPFSSGFGSGFA